MNPGVSGVEEAIARADSVGCECVIGDCYDDPTWPTVEYPIICLVCVALPAGEPCPSEMDVPTNCGS